MGDGPEANNDAPHLVDGKTADTSASRRGSLGSAV